MSTFHAECVRCEDTVRISRLSCLTKPLVLGLVFVIVSPTLIQIKFAVRTPQHTTILLAEFAIGTNPLGVIDLMPLFGDFLSARTVEAVEGARDSGIPPAVGGAVVGVGDEFGVFTAIALELCGYPAVIFLGPYDRVDAAG